MKTDLSRCINQLCLILIISLFVLPSDLFAQKKKVSFRDSLDNAIDFSDWLIDFNGFIPVPVIITEPSLGNFGFVLAPIFLTQRKPYIDTVGGKVKITPVSPDITGGVFFYTANNSWGTIAARIGTWTKPRIKYRLIAGYADVNMDFYRNFSNVGEQKFKFNFETVPVYSNVLKQFRNPRWSMGLQMLLLFTKVKYEGSLPGFVTPKEVKSTVTSVGPVIEFDNRDNIFTPNKGFKLRMDTFWSNEALASDYNYFRLNYFMYTYKPFMPNLIGALRVDGQQVFGTPPFYQLPYIDMRGIPTYRYQGEADLLTEGELRWDFKKRWSLMGFGGTGKAFDDWGNFGEAKWVYSFGSGFRYLLARKFGLRAGIDLARGPEEWAYYIVFGSSWYK